MEWDPKEEDLRSVGVIGVYRHWFRVARARGEIVARIALGHGLPLAGPLPRPRRHHPRHLLPHARRRGHHRRRAGRLLLGGAPHRPRRRGLGRPRSLQGRPPLRPPLPVAHLHRRRRLLRHLPLHRRQIRRPLLPSRHPRLPRRPDQAPHEHLLRHFRDPLPLQRCLHLRVPADGSAALPSPWHSPDVPGAGRRGRLPRRLGINRRGVAPGQRGVGAGGRARARRHAQEPRAPRRQALDGAAIFAMLSGLSFAVDTGFKAVVVENTMRLGLGYRALFGLATVAALCTVIMVALAAQAVVYFVCKSYHCESVDRAHLSDHLGAYLGEYQPLDDDNDNDNNGAGGVQLEVQMEQLP